MKKVLAITALALSGCAMPSQQSATPTTPDQLAAITAYNAEIDNANAERERERIAREAAQMQYLQNRPPMQPIGGVPIQGINPPVIKVIPVDQNGTPLYGQPQYLP